MFIQTWMWFGNTMIMLMSGIQGINPSLFEAASIDGATSGQVFRKITLPLLSPILAYTLVTSMIGGLQMFDIPYLYHKDPNKVKDHLKTVAVIILRVLPRSGLILRWVTQAHLLLSCSLLPLFSAVSHSTSQETRMRSLRRSSVKRWLSRLKAESKQFGGFSI